MRVPIPALVFAAAIALLPNSAFAEHQLIRAAPLAGPEPWSPRRLFNAGLEAEQEGNLVGAVQLYLSARLSHRLSFADELYARGAGLRLLRVLAGYDDDAATAAALLVTAEADRGGSTDLAPLIRSLLHRLEREPELEMKRGTIAALRFHKRLGAAIIELEMEEEGERRVILAEGSIGPFSAGDPVKVLIKRDSTRALASWRMVAMGHAKADGWQLIAVRGLPGQAGAASAELLYPPSASRSL